MRLIDADAQMEYCQNQKSKTISCNDIARFPTAYNVDKVMDGVNEALGRLFNFCEEIDLHLPEDERTGYNMLDDIWAIRDIIKRGGVDAV